LQSIYKDAHWKYVPTHLTKADAFRGAYKTPEQTITPQKNNENEKHSKIKLGKVFGIKE